MFLILRCQLDMRHDFARQWIPLLLFVCNEKASTGSGKILTGVCMFCESVAAASCEKNTSLHFDSGCNTGIFSVAWKHMVLTALTDTLYAHVVLIFPMIIYTDSESRPLLLVKPVMDQTVHNSLGLRIKLLFFFFSSYRNPIEICIDLSCFELCFACRLCHCLGENGKLFQSSSVFLTRLKHKDKAYHKKLIRTLTLTEASLET